MPTTFSRRGRSCCRKKPRPCLRRGFRDEDARRHLRTARHREGGGVEGRPPHAELQGLPEREQDGDQEGGRKALRSQGERGPHRKRWGKAEALRTVRGAKARLEEGVRDPAWR